MSVQSLQRTAGLALCLALWAAPVWAAPAENKSEPVQYYRYTNDKGVVVLNRQGVPPEFIAKGYQVLNEQGRVIKEVPPAPSQAERERLAELKEMAKSDAQLLRLYSTPEDVDRAKLRKREEILNLSSVARANQQSLRGQLNNLQAQAATLERGGQTVPEHLLGQISNTRGEIADLDQQIQRLAQQQQDSDKAFDADRARLIFLLQQGRR